MKQQIGKQKVKVKIAGDEYSLEIEPAKEELVRLAVSRINNEVESLRMYYSDVELKDLLSIVLLSEEVKFLNLLSKTNAEIDKELNRLEDLDELLGEYLLSR